jgi:hypothetical protein
MSGIFYDPSARCLRAVETAAPHDWTLVTHDLGASINLCRRILREWLSPKEVSRIDWSTLDRGVA